MHTTTRGSGWATLPGAYAQRPGPTAKPGRSSKGSRQPPADSSLASSAIPSGPNPRRRRSSGYSRPSSMQREGGQIARRSDDLPIAGGGKRAGGDMPSDPADVVRGEPRAAADYSGDVFGVGDRGTTTTLPFARPSSTQRRASTIS